MKHLIFQIFGIFQIIHFNSILFNFFFSFYHQNFAQAFERCLDNMQQSAFSISFPMICSHFVNCVSDFCPEERSVLRERTLTLVNNFLEGLAKKTKKVLFSIASEQSLLYEQVIFDISPEFFYPNPAVFSACPEKSRHFGKSKRVEANQKK